MPLHLVHGPPNTGRTGIVLDKYTEFLHRDPVLIVPGVDDVFTWERRITRNSDSFIGARIVTFNELCLDILKKQGGPRPPRASELRRRHLVRQAIVQSGWDEVTARLDFQPGLVDAVLELIDDFRRELIDPDTLDGRIREQGLLSLKRLAGIYRTYLDLLTGSGFTDLPREVGSGIESSALGRQFEGRPVFLTGFDDLSGQQAELIGRLAVDNAIDVWVALTYEPDNPAMKVTDRMMATLRDIGEGTRLEETATARRETPRDHDPALVELERRFMRGTSKGEAPIPATSAVGVLRSAGPRNEAEAIASGIARLLDAGTPPESIAIAIENPAAQGRLLSVVLDRFRIDNSLEAEIPVSGTATGQTVMAVLEAIRPGGPAKAAFAWLRSPLYAGQDVVDKIELDCRRLSEPTAEGVMGRLGEGRLPEHWDDLRRKTAAGEAVQEGIARIALELGNLALDTPGIPEPAAILESQAGAAIAEACEEIAAIQGPGNTGIDGIHDAIESGSVRVWSMPASGTVRIASPYSLRAKRFSHLFFSSLQERGVRDQERAGPFLSRDERGLLGMSSRTDAEDQERYLFYSCLTVPTESLWLSCRTSDETGKAEHESPLVGAVEELFEAVDGIPGVSHGGRTGTSIVFEANTAPTGREVARLLAANGGGPDRVEIPAWTRDRIDAELGEARVVSEDSVRLETLVVPEVLEALAADPNFSATAIEAYAGCPYRWFIERQLNPTEFGPDPEPMTMGSLIHNVLEKLYFENLGRMPRPETLEAWLARLPSIVEDVAASSRVRLDGDDPARAAMRRRAIDVVSTYLAKEAAVEDPLHLPREVEYGFGLSDKGADAVDMGGWFLRGKIDRIDVAPNPGPDGRAEAVVVDYKSGNVDALTHKKVKKDRKFQLPLYLRAAEVALNVNPVAGIYVPVRAGNKPSRGAFEESSRSEMLDRG
ncbi:MAG: PD-(D/E)XK nuclease family protein, partial [Solirubrobacterales bacterium]